MALSNQKLRGLAATSLGFVKVTTIGTAVPLSLNIDSNNNNAPGTAYGPTDTSADSGKSEYSPRFRGFVIYGFKPGASNNGMVANTGQIYLLQAAQGSGSGNRSDSGAILAIIGSGNNYQFPPEGMSFDWFSPYYLYLDGDNNGDGGLVTAYGGGQ